ncbi:MAG: DUF6495 family protein [Bacteroidota bacterium]
MPKYRSLTTAELVELEKEFIEYLVLNGIVAEDWEKIKQEDTERADKIIDLFSDVVFEGIMRKVRYLEYRSKQELMVFQCLEDKIVLVGMKGNGNPKVDFTDDQFIIDASVNPPKGLTVYTKDKAYKKQRELELYEMTETGCIITDDQLFKALCLALPGLSN